MPTARLPTTLSLFKLLAVQLPLVGLLVGGFLAYREPELQHRDRASIVADVMDRLGVLEPTMARAVWDSNEGYAQNLIAALGQLPHVQSAMLTTTDGQVLARIGDPALPVAGSDLQLERPLSYRGEGVGLLDIALTIQPVQSRARQRLVENGWLLLAILGGWTLATVVAARLAIRRPLAELRRAFDAAQQATLDGEQAVRRQQDERVSLIAANTAALRDRHRLLRGVLDSMAVGVAAFDEELRLIAWNQPYFAIGDYPESLAVVGSEFEDFARHDAARQAVGDNDVEASVRERLALARQFLLPAYEGQLSIGRYIAMQGGAIEGGGLVCICADIGERRNSQEALMTAADEHRCLAERFHRLTANLPALHVQFVSNSSGTWRLGEIGPAFRTAFAFGEAAVPEATAMFLERIHPDDRPETVAALTRSFRNGDPFHQTFRIRRPGSETMWLEATAWPGADVDGEVHWDGVIADVSAHRHAEERERLARAEAEAASRSASALLAAMDQVVRPSLGDAVGAVERLRAGELASEQRQMTNTVEESATALLYVVDEILDLAKIAAGRNTLERSPVSIRNTVEWVAGKYLPVIARKDWRLALFIDPAIPPRVLTDAARLRSILADLLGAAAGSGEAAVEAAATIGLRTEFAADAQGAAWARFAVRGLAGDTGGQGLDRCRELTGQLGGRIEAEDNGASVTLLLPLEPVTDAPAEDPGLSGIRILFAVRHDDLVEAIERYIAGRGGQASRALSLHDLERRAAGRDVVILSEAWAGGRCEQVVARLRQRVPGIRFVIISCDPLARTGLVQADTVVMRGQPFRRSEFLAAVAMAAGQVAPPAPMAAPAATDAVHPSAAGAIDERVLHATFGEDEQTIRDIMADFIGPARTHLADILQAQAGRTTEGVVQAAQRLTSAARAIGAHRLADAGAALERAGQADAWDDIDAQVAGIEATFQAVLAQIGSYRTARPTGAGTSA